MSSSRPWEEVSGTGGLQGQGNEQRGVNLSVAVSFVLVCFLFPCTVGVGWLVLWHCVMMWVWWVEVARESGCRG